MQQFGASTGVPPQQLYSKVELSISGERLINADFLSKSDPVCVVKLQTGDEWRVVGMTEMIKDDLNPVFNRTITLEYHFEEQQLLLFEMWDIDQKVFQGQIDSTVDDTLGSMRCSLGEIVGSRGQTLRRMIHLPGRRQGTAGFVIVRAEELGSTRNDIIRLRFRGERLKKMDFFGKSDPYYIISKKMEDSTWQQTYKSEVIKFTLNPRWQLAPLTLQKFGGSYDHPCKFDCYDWNRLTKPDYIGSFEFTLNQLKREATYELRYAKKPRSRRGTIHHEMEIEEKFTFFEYIAGGLEISLTVAIDFTSSNGTPTRRSSLHYISDEPNEYEAAIRSVGDVLAPYDSDNMYPVFGFGGNVPRRKHCFPLNGNFDDPEVEGVEGILEIYHKAIQEIPLSGPTNFADVINVTSEIAAGCGCCQDVQQMHILLILTDGRISDFRKTVAAIVSASYQPLSIIIVGVGNADFSSMDDLDCDDGLLKAQGQVARDDIVQFVPFRKFRHNFSLLSRETLAEVPLQVENYFKYRGIKPNPKPEPLIDPTSEQWGALQSAIPSLAAGLGPVPSGMVPVGPPPDGIMPVGPPPDGIMPVGPPPDGIMPVGAGIVPVGPPPDGIMPVGAGIVPVGPPPDGIMPVGASIVPVGPPPDGILPAVIPSEVETEGE